MPEIEEFIDETGRVPFAIWFHSLERTAAAAVAVALLKLRRGLTGGLKSVGTGVFECKVSMGPGYRIYFGYDGPMLVILLGGGDKSSQQRDITLATKLWANYRDRKSVADQSNALKRPPSF